MQSKTSFFNLAIFIKNIKRGLPASIAYLVLLLVMGPINFILTYVQEETSVRTGYIPEAALAGIMQSDALDIFCNTGGMCAGMLLAVFAVVICFSYLYNTKTANMMAAFPVSRVALYFTSAMAAIAILVVPQLINLIVSLILNVAFGTHIAGYILFTVYAQIVMTFFFIGFATFTAMISGQILTVFVFFGILNFCVIAMQTIVYTYMNEVCFGLIGNSRDLFSVNGLTPFVYAMDKIGVQTYHTNYADTYKAVIDKVTISGQSSLLGFALAGLVFFTIGYFMYQKKHMETVNDFIAVPILKPVFSWCMSFFTALYLATGIATILEYTLYLSKAECFISIAIFTVILDAIICIICEMLIRKNFRVFDKKCMKKACIFAASALVIVCAIKLDVFGTEKKMPNINDVEWVALNYDNIAVCRDTDEIAKVMDLHRTIIDCRKDLTKTYNEAGSGRYINIKYQLKNGKNFTRGYYMPADTSISKEYDGAVERLYDLVNDTEFIKKHFLYVDENGNDTMKLDSFNISLGTPYPDGGWEWHDYNDHSKDMLEAFHAALIKDVEAGNLYRFSLDEVYDSGYAASFYLVYRSMDGSKIVTNDNLFYGYETSKETTYNEYFNIDRNCTNTIEFMIDSGIINSADDIHSWSELKY